MRPTEQTMSVVAVPAEAALVEAIWMGADLMEVQTKPVQNSLDKPSLCQLCLHLPFATRGIIPPSMHSLLKHCPRGHAPSEVIFTTYSGPVITRHDSLILIST
ncbi:hypothetical protein E3N88_38682 [Mikania micrantha]|uniref:Uncharacterized protein n=1 Tax=Mikania micrantha TaxID=192012 RepID=A0A5N6LVJ7_9ASTR|nr:hypothetical protein E3N88_38682 [Mikania micrantha]